tara:strand:+ start:829 stop:1122 length:294 start_codon:yes stop_codon:yes gene_type:complete
LKIDSIPELDRIEPAAFASGPDAMRIIHRAALIFFAYILIVVFPAYQLCRFWWDPSYEMFTVANCLIAFFVALGFGLFTRASVRGSTVLRAQADHSG